MTSTHEKANRFTRGERLLTAGDYRTVLSRGKRFAGRHFIVYVKPNRGGQKRLGIIASKKVGNAVRRNRAKRLAREFFRLSKKRIKPGTDIVVVARRGSGELGLAEVMRDFERTLGMLRKPG